MRFRVDMLKQALPFHLFFLLRRGFPIFIQHPVDFAETYAEWSRSFIVHSLWLHRYALLL